jgi:SNF2 family DNA or RNA helicase
MNFYHDTKRNLLVYEAPSPLHVAQLLQSLPEARQINGAFVAVPATLKNSQTLRWLQYPVVPVITDQNYDWPRSPEIEHPYKTQKITANFLVLNKRCCDLSDMGVGKTLPAAWAADFLMRQHPGMRTLVVSTLSTTERVWGKTIFSNFFGKRTADILHGSAEKRMSLLANSKADFLVINFDGVGVGARTYRHSRTKQIELAGFSKALADRKDIIVVIIDEASFGYRDAQTRRNKIARLGIAKNPYLWLLTGTPTPNDPTDAYGLAKLVNNAHGKSFHTFREETMYKLGNMEWNWKPRKEGYELARRLLSPSIRFDISSVWDGPPVTVQQRQVELTAEQKKKLEELKRDMMVTLKSGKQIDAINEAAKRNKFLQIIQGAIYDGDHLVHTIDAEPRFREIEAVIESTKRKLVIFCNLTSVLDILYKRLSKKWKLVILNGRILPKNRSDNIRMFECDPDVKAVLADPQTTAHGINELALVADTVVWTSATDKNELYLQGNKRVNRPGQKYPMTIVQIVSSKLEQEIYRRLETHTSLQGAMLDMVRRGEI